ncbi:MAG TPA: hypothetical protein VL994_14140 [Steroidobacteraceae bacterium]|nr:hypothetical protein [Steroidobacteraceae bacterium]
MYYSNGFGFGTSWIIVAIVGVIPFWRICKRVGHSEWLSLLLLVPIANLIFVYWLAFGDWPIQKTSSGTG